ncbi:MAG TPA: CDP-alcohol phosphatidyltransferase family protein [Actinocrinis sp.]|nr:CDP-alcohol phosphatidyltransferase family protein [Actinocrinis sp.]
MTEQPAAEPPAPEVGDRIVTIPNALSALRLLGVPLFLWLVLRPVWHGPKEDGWAVGILMVAGFTDYLDGKLARALGQTSRLGQVLDPAADRLYILATLIGLAARHIIPWWLLVVLVGRDVALLFVVPTLKRLGLRLGLLPVHLTGKAATFNLLYAFPLLLLGDGSGWLHTTADVVGWAFAIWGTVLYWLAGGIYVAQVRRLARQYG